MSLADVFGIVAILLGIAAIVDLRLRSKRARDIFAGRKDLSWQQMDELVGQEIKEEQSRRTKLRHEAASNVRSARQLQRELQDDLQEIDDIRRNEANKGQQDRAGMEQLSLRRKQLEQELNRVADVIRQLRA